MTMILTDGKKRTIVRFLLVALGAMLLSACAGSTARTGRLAPCAPPAMPICEAFGSESRCACADAAALERYATGLGQLATVPRGW